MNPTSMTSPPAQAIEAATSNGKQKDSAAAEVPFSQVLSGEMAQTRAQRGAKDGAQDNAEAVPDADKRAATTAEAGQETLAVNLALPPAEAIAVAPETLLALAINPDLLKPAMPAGQLAAEATEAAEADAGQRVFADARKGRPTRGAQPEALTDPTRGAQKANPAAKPDLPAAASATAAAAFSAQLADARPATFSKAGEALPDFMNHAGLRAVAQATAAQNEAAAPRLTPSVGTTAWGQALGEKMVWMAAGAQQTASLTLNPPNLGPLQIVLNVSNDQATASFFSAQPEVRQALEAAFPRLKEMMSEAGIQLGQATVSADTPQQHDTSERQAQRLALPFGSTDEALAAGQQPIQITAPRVGRGLVDTFA